MKPSHMNGFYSLRAANLYNEYFEDYEDIDVSTDVQDELNQLEFKNLFGWTYSLSERWHLTFLDELTYAEQDERYITPAKVEDSYDFGTQALENAFAANLKFITNPNPYRYKELNLSVGRVDGTSDSDTGRTLRRSQQTAQRGYRVVTRILRLLNSIGISGRGRIYGSVMRISILQKPVAILSADFMMSLGDLYEVFGEPQSSAPVPWRVDHKVLRFLVHAPSVRSNSLRMNTILCISAFDDVKSYILWFEVFCQYGVSSPLF